jgi:hypothetical protein
MAESVSARKSEPRGAEAAGRWVRATFSSGGQRPVNSDLETRTPRTGAGLVVPWGRQLTQVNHLILFKYCSI